MNLAILTLCMCEDVRPARFSVQGKILRERNFRAPVCRRLVCRTYGRRAVSMPAATHYEALPPRGRINGENPVLFAHVIQRDCCSQLIWVMIYN